MKGEIDRTMSYHTLYLFSSLAEGKSWMKTFIFSWVPTLLKFKKKKKTSHWVFLWSIKSLDLNGILKNNDSFHTIKFMEIGNVGSWKRDEWIQWTFCWRDLWRIFSILDSIINQCHGQCEKCIRCHSFSISLSAFFSDVIFKIYTLVLFRIKKKSITDYKGTLKHDGAFFFF